MQIYRKRTPGGGAVRPRLAIALPGINLTPRVSYWVALIPLIEALQARYDVTVVVRSILEDPGTSIPIRTILARPDVPSHLPAAGRAFFLGSDFLNRADYITKVEHFGAELAGEFDVVFEKQWSYVGALTVGVRARGGFGGFAYEGEFYDGNGGSGRLNPVRLARQTLEERMRARIRRRGFAAADFISAETDEALLQIRKHIGPHCHALTRTIGQGIDPAIFRPRDRDECRAALGLVNEDKILLTYVGSLNGSIQHPDTLLEGLGASGNRRIVLHVVGDGDKAASLKSRAEALGLDARFHGFKPQSEAAIFVGAADLCLAPYKPATYRHGVFTSASCKVPEYLASGRPVLTIPCGRMHFLTGGGRYGFMVDDEAGAYARFFWDMPERGVLRDREETLLKDLSSSRLSRAGIVETWSDIADGYHDLFERTRAIVTYAA